MLAQVNMTCYVDFQKGFAIKFLMRPMMRKIIHFWFPYRKKGDFT